MSVTDIVICGLTLIILIFAGFEFYKNVYSSGFKDGYEIGYNCGMSDSKNNNGEES